MAEKAQKERIAALAIGLFLLFLVAGLVATLPVASAGKSGAGAEERAQAALDRASPAEPSSPCPGGPVIDGITLDECYVESFMVGGVNKSITVWYTKQHIPVYRMIDDVLHLLEHWINSDSQAQQAAAWGRQAWEQYWEIFHHHPYQGSCDNVNVQIEDGIRGYAEVPQPGYCWIHIGADWARNAGDPAGIYHEFAHAVQDGYPACLVDQQAHWPADVEYIEGYACVDADAVDAGVDEKYFGGSVAAYSPTLSFFDHGGDNVANKYYLEQVGVEWPTDPLHYHMDAVRHHYEECENQGDLYILDTLIPALTGGKLTHETLFLNFFAANWAKAWADPDTQPELVYADDATVSYGQIWLAHDVPLSGLSLGWVGETTPDDWAATYYQVRPQPGCDYVSVAVDGAPGALLGINLMAADTAIPYLNVVRSAWIGNSLARTFPGAGVHDRVVAIVNAFDLLGSYDVSFACVTPALNVLEPRAQPNPALVGEPDSPTAFLARFKVTSAGSPVHGLPETSFTADAEGDAVTIVPGSFQEVGDEYWAVMLAPVKPSTTTLVDLKVCLLPNLCQTQTDALLYEARGHTDFALTFDASASMLLEDVVGEGRRIENAQKAGTVLADLLQNDDRVMVLGFSANDNPVGCPLPVGDGWCEFDFQYTLLRTDVVVPGTIAQAEAAIQALTPDMYTPIGEALLESTYGLEAPPVTNHPKVIVLLSDGEENVRPLYAEISEVITSAGVIVDTVGFGLPGGVGEATLAQIAADTGGVFRFVPTTQGTLSSPSAEQVDGLRQRGVPEEMLSRLTAAWQPGPLALDDVYDYLDSKAQGATRLFSVAHPGVPFNEWRVVSQYVAGGMESLRFVAAGKQEDNGTSIYRDVSIMTPGPYEERRWIPISPPGTELPATWDVRNSPFDDVVIIPDPEKGLWRMRARYRANAGTYDFGMMGSAQSEVLLQGRFLSPIVDNQGHPGDVVPIVAVLLDADGTVPGASVFGTLERPGGAAMLWLYDDGQHSDGAAGDGIYGTLYAPTDTGGAYNVRLLASWDDPDNPGNTLAAEWLGSFYIEPPDLLDADGDGMPDDWERRCGLDPARADGREDLDRDGLLNLDEFHAGSLPCEDDTDHGGEGDGSEVPAGRNPLEPADDTIRRLPHISVRPLNGKIRIDWSHPRDYEAMRVFVSTTPGELGSPVEMGSSGAFTLTQTPNDLTHYLTFQALSRSGLGAFSERRLVTPKADPDAPSGYVVINDGMAATSSVAVTLTIVALDSPPPGAAMRSPAADTHAVSAGLQMRISNDPFLRGAAWEPLASGKAWRLGESDTDVHVVYAQFRDAAGNESLVAWDDIRLEAGPVYLPLVMRQAW